MRRHPDPAGYSHMDTSRCLRATRSRSTDEPRERSDTRNPLARRPRKRPRARTSTAGADSRARLRRAWRCRGGLGGRRAATAGVAHLPAAPAIVLGLLVALLLGRPAVRVARA